MKESRLNRLKDWFRKNIRIPRGVIIAVCVLPVVLTALFYVLRSYPDIMDWVSLHISAPVRAFSGFLSSIYPFSMMEVLCTIAALFFIYYIVKAIRDTSRRREKWKLLGKRLLPVLNVALYIWNAFCWLWLSGYHAPGFAKKNNFSSSGVALSDLILVTGYFADKANEYALMMERDEYSHYIANRREMFAASTGIYRNIAGEFSGLSGRLYPPKSMLFSWLMSITGYTGMYFALTGEAMINTQPPGYLMPATVAHEHAHQLGVYAEDEASFVGILACVTSDNAIFEYAGYMSGLSYLLNALGAEDFDEWLLIITTLTYEVNVDRFENYAFWASQKRSDTGIRFIDDVLTAVMETTSDAVNTIYDGFLKSNNQELGLKSYGACVDLLVEYFSAKIRAEAIA